MRLGNSPSGFFSLLSLFFGGESGWAVAFLFSLIRNLFVLLRNLSAECVSAQLGSFCSCEIERRVHFNSTQSFSIPMWRVRTPKFGSNSKAFYAGIFWSKTEVPLYLQIAPQNFPEMILVYSDHHTSNSSH